MNKRVDLKSNNNLNDYDYQKHQTGQVPVNHTLAKLNLNNIYTVEPLRIKLHEHDEPRPPTLEESEVFISKLYDLYKHQKQQVSLNSHLSTL